MLINTDITYDSKNKVKIPDTIDHLVHIDSDLEIDPYQVDITPDQINKIWLAFIKCFRSGFHSANSLVIRKKGHIIFSRSLGFERIDQDFQKHAFTSQTPICVYSVSKSITAMLILKLQELGRLHINDLISQHIPEFGCHGKEAISIKHLLTHRAGISQVPTQSDDIALLTNWHQMVKLLCQQKIDTHPEQHQAYHALTSGYILGEIIMRICDDDINEVLAKYIAKPLNCNMMTYGIDPSLQHECVRSIFTGPKQHLITSNILKRTLGNYDLEKVTHALNSAPGLDHILPSGNVFASAQDINKFYQCILNQGHFEDQQLFKPETIKVARTAYGEKLIDGTVNLPMRFSPAFMLGEDMPTAYGWSAPEAFGHLGLMTVAAWADPQRDISVAFLNNGKSLDPSILMHMIKVNWCIARQLG